MSDDEKEVQGAIEYLDAALERERYCLERHISSGFEALAFLDVVCIVRIGRALLICRQKLLELSEGMK